MATNKEEVLFKVKAELSGFKKSMDDLKKMAKETSNNVKKSMNMDLSKEGSNAGKTFAKGFNEEMKSATDSVKLELKKLAEQASNIKIKVDITEVESLKRQLYDITVNVPTESNRANASMSNNANAPNNGMNTMASITNSGALTKLTAVMNGAINSMNSAVKSMNTVGEKIESSSVKMRAAANVVQDSSRAVKAAGDKFRESGKQIKDASNRISGVGAKISSAAEKIERACALLNKSTGSIIDDTKDRIKHPKKLTPASANSIKDTEMINNNLRELEKAVEESKRIAKIQELSKQKSILEKSISAINKGSNNFKEGSDPYKTVQGSLARLKAELKDVEAKLQECKKSSGNAFNELSVTIDDANESVEKIRMNLTLLSRDQGKSSSAIRGLIKSLSTLANAFKKVSINLPLNAISKAASIIKKEFTIPLNAASTLMTNFGKKMSEVGAKVLYPTNLIKVFGTSIKQLGTELKNGFNNISTKWIDKITNGLEVGKNKFYSFCDALSNYPDNVNKAFKSMGTAINNDIKRLGNLMSNLGSKVKSFSVDPSGSIKKAMSSIKNSIGTEQLEAARSTVKNFTDEVYNKFPGIKKHVENVKQSFSNMGNNIKKALNPINLISSASRKAADGIRRIGNESSAASGKVDKLKGSFTGLIGKLGMFFSVYQLFGLMKQGTEDAIKYEAGLINIQKTFGEASKSLTDFANKNAIAFGISKKQAVEYGNIFSVIVKNMQAGMTPAATSPEDAARKSNEIAKNTMNTTKELLKSAGMISSALGYDVEYVLEGLRSGILGSSEAVDQFGLNLKQANLEASQAFMEVSNNGQIAWNNLTEAQRQYVITQEIINQTTRNFGKVLGQNGKMMQTTASLQAQYMAQLSNTKLALGVLGKVLWTAILPPLTKILAVLERVFYYAASAMTALLELFGIQVDFSSPASTGGALTGLQDNLGNINDTANDAFNTMEDSSSKAGDKTKKSLGKVGNSAKKAAKDTEEAAKKVKRALAGFDQINVLNIKEDDKPPKPPEDIVDPPRIDDFDPFDLNDFNPDPYQGKYGIPLPDLTPQTKSNLDKFKGFVDKMKNLLNELTEPFKKAWDFLGDRWIAAWNRLKKEFKNFCDSLAKFLRSVWENGKRFSAVIKFRKIGGTLIIITKHILDIKEMII